MLELISTFYALVAQLDRAFGYEPKGRGFESLQAQFNLKLSRESFFVSKLSRWEFYMKECACKSKVSFWQDLKSNLSFLFSYQDIDEHFVIKFFGIKFCKKHKLNYEFIPVTEYGLTQEKRNPKLVVSLTTFPARINVVHKTISTLLEQTLKPDVVILWLAESQFPNKELPKSLTDLEQFGLTIKWCEDIKSFKKLIPTLQEYPDDIIVTVDDDTYYDKKLIETLYNEYLKRPDCIHARQAFVLKLDKKNNELFMQARNYTYNSTYLPSFWNEPVGCGGVLYPPHCLHENVLNKEQFTKEMPTHDDLWFWGHAIRNNTKINVIKGNYKLKNLVIDGSQEDSLWQKNMINSTSTVGMTGRQALNKVCSLFPEIREKLEGEKRGC